jgi:hypothetical protein
MLLFDKYKLTMEKKQILFAMRIRLFERRQKNVMKLKVDIII